MVTSNPLVLLLAIGFVWWGQGAIFPILIRPFLDKNHNKSNSNTGNQDAAAFRFQMFLAVFLVASTGLTYVLADYLHQSLSAYSIKPAIFILLWYPLAMQLLRYLHLLVVAPIAFLQEFGWLQHSDEAMNNPQWLRVFMWAAPTMVFPTNDNQDNNDDDKTNKKRSFHKPPPTLDTTNHHFRVILVDLLWIVAICSSVLMFQMGTWLPDWMQRILRVYIMGLSTSLVRLVHECPLVWYIHKHQASLPQGTTFIPLYDQPYWTTSPRELWRRWSVTAGFHLRKAFYEPLLNVLLRSDKNEKTKTTTIMSTLFQIVAAAAPFFVNCVLHIYWWSMGVKGEVDSVYWILLFWYPLLSFAVEDLMLKRFFRMLGDGDPTTSQNKTWLHHFANIVLLWGGFYLVGEPMAYAHALNSDLTAVCRANLLLPPSSVSSKQELS